MECKNCERPLGTDYSFCSNCGAKIIRNRLTFKSLWYDISERYFNLDNTFLKTFWHLFIKPEKVIGGYVNGVRKKYLNPFSYYAIAITVSGLLFFIVKEFFPESLNMDWMMPKGGTQMDDEIFDRTAKYQTIISLVSIPLYAFLSKLVFLKNKKLNYTEHVVLNTYLFGQYSIAYFPCALIALSLGMNYMVFTYIGLLFYVFYFAYSLKRIYQLSWGTIFLKTLLFIFILLIAYIASTVIFLVVTFLSGGVEGLKELAKPPPQ
jgi:hypothetical protein